MATAFEDANDADPKDLLGKLHQITLPYDTTDIPKWVKRLEVKMETYGVASQWSKRIVFENNLPSAINDELSDFLTLSKAEANATIYKDMKNQFLKTHGPQPEDNYRKAQSLVLQGTPSATARTLVQLMCHKKKKLEGCCCSHGVSAKWRDLLPDQVKAQVANMSLAADDFNNTVEYADKVWRSMHPEGARPTVAAVQSDVSAQPISAAAGASAQAVAAIKHQKVTGKKEKGQKPRKRRDPNDPSTWGKPHADGPPAQSCMYHFVYGRNAYFCSKPEVCPWKNLANPPKHA